MKNHFRLAFAQSSLIRDPGGQYIGHVTPASGSGCDIVKYILKYKEDNDVGIKKLESIGVKGVFGFSLCMAGILLAGCDAVINILWFVLSLFSLGIAISGVLISGVDMALAFAEHSLRMADGFLAESAVSRQQRARVPALRFGGGAALDLTRSSTFH
ncbi:hypothetical protein AVEN_231873-1 [Araneus ventricosus]|uniref:Uncharacterized protein n=1 Tax=Araneus ventricosus TaxID=182803 RepID=A0A4Y2LTA0_ARAVE|nr:hypothetical protein AVEN_231873-1 [Araneus ventricosus]